MNCSGLKMTLKCLRHPAAVVVSSCKQKSCVLALEGIRVQRSGQCSSTDVFLSRQEESFQKGVCGSFSTVSFDILYVFF